ncbi:MAG TPA: hypothetical protein PKE64_05000 [Anaerolineae bacterium]|nr:hypothetical protein [Anaerolineae bacterium]HMR63352.1 hypothetical protein [Anaerolineae bacterium]
MVGAKSRNCSAQTSTRQDATGRNLAAQISVSRNTAGRTSFIDWENMHGAIRGKANISALREVAASYGRLVLAKAYADWREIRYPTTLPVVLATWLIPF